MFGTQREKWANIRYSINLVILGSVSEVMQHQTFSYMTLPTFLSLNILGVEIGISARLLNNLIVFLMVVLRAGDERMVGWGHHWVEENKTIFHVHLC